MAEILNNYPTGCTEEQINQIVKELSSSIVTSGGNINSVMQLAPLVQLGQNELQKRIIEKSVRNSERAANIAVGLSIFSVLLTLVAIGLAYLSFQSDEDWKKEETQLLTSINKNLLPDSNTRLLQR